MKILPHKLPTYVNHIDNKLLSGKAVCCPHNLYSMKQNGITQIIDLRNTPSITKYLEMFFCKIFGINYVNCRYPHRLNVLPEEKFFKNVNKVIIDNDAKTYIHCQKGKRRTGISVAYYEKNVMQLEQRKILDKLFERGYKDININTKIGKKYCNILIEFIDKYLPETKTI